MQRIYPDLWQTPLENPMEDLFTHAYFWSGPRGNVLFYNTGRIDSFDQMAKLGGVRWHFLSHRDELGKTLLDVRERFGAMLGGHVAELEYFSPYREPDWVFDQREPGPAGVEIIPTPGHTAGSTCFLVEATGGKSYLFTGDTLCVNEQKELDVAFFAGISDAGKYGQSLDLLRSIDPDVVLSSACGGVTGHLPMTPERWKMALDRAAAQLLEQSSACA